MDQIQIVLAGPNAPISRCF